MSLRPRSPSAPVSRIFAVKDPDTLRSLCGPHHQNLERLEQRFEDFSLRAESQGGGIMLFGAAQGVTYAENALSYYLSRLQAGTEPGEIEFENAINQSINAQNRSGSGPVKGLRTQIQAQTAGQTAYLAALQNDENGLVFGVGPAGTGKTFLAVAIGASALATGKCERLIVARPAVEAGEKLGFANLGLHSIQDFDSFVQRDNDTVITIGNQTITLIGVDIHALNTENVIFAEV